MAFAADPDICFWEVEVTPPGIDGGDPVDTTTMLNETWRTRAPRALYTLTNAQLTAAYDPEIYTNILALINVETAITVHFPDGSTVAFYGFLQTFTPAALVEGTQPRATIVIVPTNQDPTSGAEEAPVVTSVAGT
jgi:hypothetical protein